MSILMSATRSPSNVTFKRLVNGAAAGLAATVPMTVSMLVGWSLLPRREQYPLPPRLITEEITERVGIKEEMTNRQLTVATLFSHFSYGAAAGAAYALVEPHIPMTSGLKGTFAGLLIWAGSYLGWIPAARILPPATEHPWRRNLLMIAAHVVWGATLGIITRKLESKEQ